MLASYFAFAIFSSGMYVLQLPVRVVRVFLQCLNYVCILVQLDWITSAEADVNKNFCFIVLVGVPDIAECPDNSSIRYITKLRQKLLKPLASAASSGKMQVFQSHMCLRSMDINTCTFIL